MKQTNKLVNLLNIVFIISIILVCIEGRIIDVGEIISCSILININAVLFINCFMGIKNLLKGNKKIGIINIILVLIITLMFEMFYFVLAEVYEIEEILLYILIIGVSIIIILSIINLILNKKTEDTSKKKYRLIIFIIILIIEIVIIIMPVILNIINKMQIEKAIEMLKVEKNTVLICDSANEQEYYLKGKLINKTYYDEIYSYIYKKHKQIFIGEKDGQMYIIDYKGKIIGQIYGEILGLGYLGDLIDGLERVYKNEFFEEKNNYLELEFIQDEIKIKNLDSEMLPDDSTKVKYTFGKDRVDAFKIIVELDKNVLEEKVDIYEDYMKKIEEMSDEELYQKLYNQLQDLYKFKKHYYLETADGKKIELNCNNLIFGLTPSFDNLAIIIYGNNYIPYCDNENSGYFNLTGEKSVFDSRYLVYSVKENYNILYDMIEKKYCIAKKNNEIYSNTIEEITYNCNEYILVYVEEKGCFDIYAVLDNEIIRVKEKNKIFMSNYIENKKSPFKYIGIIEEKEY